ncbi:F-box family protein isoform 2 [Tripterygium wilfordii]|uniref:F-box family protein isoform 2 n=1 Tax=Tripterygium wilfordii TaxID=458696 RepID=A0A7J7DFF4_TRIWF|nr:F-box family protein isoform 2 [Tripterygium wilfordii]
MSSGGISLWQTPAYGFSPSSCTADRLQNCLGKTPKTQCNFRGDKTPEYLPLKPPPPWASEMRLLSLCFWKQVSIFSISNFIKNTLCRLYITGIPSTKEMGSSLQVEATNECSGMSLLDLPELTLECILERLPPSGLCSMADVCMSLRERCVSNHLWEKHMKQKWGRLMGPAAHREWQWYLASRDSVNLGQGRQRGLMKLLSIVWPFWWVRSRIVDSTNNSKRRSYLPVDSIMSWYLALETGKFWFPAQVYNRENGHVGFIQLYCLAMMLS